MFVLQAAEPALLPVFPNRTQGGHRPMDWSPGLSNLAPIGALLLGTGTKFLAQNVILATVRTAGLVLPARLNNSAQFGDSHGSRVAPPRLRVGLPPPKRASLAARSVSEGTGAPWLAVGRVVAVLSQNCEW